MPPGATAHLRLGRLHGLHLWVCDLGGLCSPSTAGLACPTEPRQCRDAIVVLVSILTAQESFHIMPDIRDCIAMTPPAHLTFPPTTTSSPQTASTP